MTRALDETAVRATTTRRHAEPLTVVTVLALIATCALLVSLGLSRASPVFFGDEIGYLANSLALSGGPSMHLDAGTYYPGWSLVIAPLWWITSDPLKVYRGAVVLASLSVVATIPVLALLGTSLPLPDPRQHVGRRQGGRLRTKQHRLDLRWALLAACVAVALPSRALLSGFALSEAFLGLVVAAATLAAFRAATDGRLGWWTACGALSGFAFVVHGRAIPLVVAACLWAVWLLVRRQVVRGLLLGASALLVSGLGFVLYEHVASGIYSDTGRETENVARLFASAIGTIALSASGQIWVSVVGTGGLVVLGSLAVIDRIRREWRDRAPSAALWFALVVVGFVLVSVTSVSVPVGLDERLDFFVYGRYIEPAVDVLAFFGIVLLIEGLTRRRAMIALCATALVVVGYAVVAHLFVPPVGHTTYASNVMNVLGLSPFSAGSGSGSAAWSIPLVGASIAALALVVVALLLRVQLERPTAAVAALLAAALAGSIVGQVATVVPAYAQWQNAFALAEVVDSLPAASISYDLQADTTTHVEPSAVARNAYQFFLAPRSVPIVDSTAGDLPTTDLVVARMEWATGARAGWRKVADDVRYDEAIWVRAGPLQDQLAAEGRLVG